MIIMKLQVIVTVVFMLVSLSITAAPFDDNFTMGDSHSTLFSKDIDINKFGKNLQKRNLQVKKVDYIYSQRAEQLNRISILNGVEDVSAMPQVALQNNTWNGYTRTGVDAVTEQNVNFNRPMTIDAYSARTQVTEAFADNVAISIENMQYVSEDGFYGDGAQPGPITDVVWGFLFFAIGYICIRRRC